MQVFITFLAFINVLKLLILRSNTTVYKWHKLTHVTFTSNQIRCYSTHSASVVDNKKSTELPYKS